MSTSYIFHTNFLWVQGWSIITYSIILQRDWSPELSAFYLTCACLLWEWVACGNSLFACVFIMYHVLYTMIYFPFVRCFSPCMWKFLSPPIGPLVFPGPLFMNQREQVLARIRPLQAFKLMRERLKGTAVFTTDSTWSPIMPFFLPSFNNLYSTAFFGTNNISFFLFLSDERPNLPTSFLF